MRTVIAALMALCIGVLGFTAPSAAAAGSALGGQGDAAVLSASEIAEVEQNLDELEIDDVTQSSLMTKLRRGVLPASATGDDEVRSWVEERDGGKATVYEYADGSRKIVGIRPVNSEVSLLLEHNCEEPQGAGYWVWGPCQIYVIDPISEAGFTASWVFTVDHERFPAEIRKAEGKYCAVVGGTAECDLSVSRWVATETDSARATLDWYGELWNGTASSSGEIWLDVSPGSWYMDESQWGSG